MKIYATSDLHGKLEDLDPSGCDVCVIAGDFAKMTGFGKWHVYDQKKWVEKKFIPFIRSFGRTEFVIVPGNHDLFADPKYRTAWPDLNFNVTWPVNSRFLLNTGCEINGLKFWGSPNIPIISYRWAFESEHDVLAKTFNLIPYRPDVLITHSPPRVSDCLVDYSLQTGQGPFGSSELTTALYEKKPKILFCGHIHSGLHGMNRFEDTDIYNVARVDESYELAYKPTIVEI